MIYTLFQRVIQACFVLLLVALVAFSMFRFVGDPVQGMLGQEATSADREALRERLGLTDPIVLQYARFVLNAVQGEFGVSYRTG